MKVRPKKHLGQHFLLDHTICQDIAAAIPVSDSFDKVLEIGPGTGALTRYLLEREDFETFVVELDQESVVYLEEHFEKLNKKIFPADFLQMDVPQYLGDGSFVVAGNFPYNISSQILFKVLEFKDKVPYVVGMFQKEVAERVAAEPGFKKYGIISVLLQAWYDIEYLFTVDEHVFDPPPKVKSGVIRLTRNNLTELPCDEKKFVQIVKMAFQQRRKTLRNSLKPLLNHLSTEISPEILAMRPEALSVADFIELTKTL